MRRAIIIRTIMALLLLLNGAAVAAAQPAPAKPSLSKPTAAKQAVAKQPPAQNGNCVGVMSQLGDKFTIKKIGITAFGNEEHKITVEPWHIDDLVTAKISGLLGKRATVLRVPYKKDAFASLNTLKLFRDLDAEFGEVVRTIAAGTRCVRYVLVTEAGSRYGSSNQSLGGLGIVTSKVVREEFGSR